MAHAVAVGEDQHGLVRGVELRQCALEVEDADLAGVGFALAAFAPSGVAELGCPGVAEGDAIGGPLFEAQGRRRLTGAQVSAITTTGCGLLFDNFQMGGQYSQNRRGSIAVP